MLINRFEENGQIIYYFFTRDELKRPFQQQISLEDNSLFYYSIKPYELTNTLHNIIAFFRNIFLQRKMIIMDNSPTNYLREKRVIEILIIRKSAIAIKKIARF